ncbi:hypothetical protein BRC81_11435 [Halobacteriales archaeon QS_1_68_20]|nr:MAG: hypothetical protein BRC81_11435 [Halobacteriales archaeon QS_1_68_20]
MVHEANAVSRRGVLATAASGAVIGASGLGTAAGRTVDVDPGLAEATGTVDVLVRLEGPADPETGPAERRDGAATRAEFRSFAADRPGVEVKRGFRLANAVLVSLDTETASVGDLAAVDAVAGLEANRAIEPPEPGAVGTTSDGDAAGATTPTETTGGFEIPNQSGGSAPEFAYGLERVNAPAVWQFYGTRGEGVEVAVVDSGVDPSGHEGIQAALERGGWAEFDESGERVDGEPTDPNGHGTGVCGIVAGGATDEGVRYGVAPEVNLYAARMTDRFASGLAAIEWAVENGADVLSISWGSMAYSPMYVRAVENARAAGTLVVASVGNAGRYTSVNPGNLPTTVGVGAVDESGAVPAWSGGERVEVQRYWDGSAPGDWPGEYTVPDVTAPGVDVPSAEPGGGYAEHGGTSSATPYVAGVAALVLAATDADGGTDVEDLLVETARHPGRWDSFAVDPGRDGRHGAGVVDAMYAASVGNAEETLSGTITGPDGAPIEGALVRSETGPQTTTGPDGTYTLEVPPGEQPVGAAAPGYDLAFDFVDPAARDELDLSLPRSDAPAVSLARPLATRVEPGERVAATFEVANTDRVTVQVETNGLLTGDGLALSVDGQRADFGESVALGDSSTEVTIEFLVEGRVGQFEPSVRFEGAGDPAAGTLDRVHVHPDPWQIDPGAPSLQAPIELAAPGTVIELAGGTYEESVEEGAPAAVVVDEPVVLVAAGDDPPRIEVTTAGADAAVFVSANDVELAGIEIDAGGADAVVQAGVGFRDRESVAPSGVTLRGSVLTGGTRGVVANFAPALRVVNNEITVEGTGVDVLDYQRTTVRRNVIRGGETGIAVSGLATEVADNEISEVAGAGILVETPEVLAANTSVTGSISGNRIADVADGILVRGYAAAGIENNELSGIRGTAIGVDGTVLGPIRSNTVDGAAVGLAVEGSVDGPVEGNEFSDVDRATSEEVTTASGNGTAGGGDAVGGAPGDSVLDLVLYAATALAVGLLVLPRGLRRMGGR